MVKKKREKPKREVTKRQLSRWQQQKRRQRIILIAGISVIAAVVGIILGNWYTNTYQPLHQTVIEVNDRKFNMDYYIKMLRLYGKDTPMQYMTSLADQVVRVIQQNELIVQGAKELGITVSDDSVDEELNNQEPPLSKDYRDVVRAQLVSNQLYEDYFDNQVPYSDEQRQIMAMLLESENQAVVVRAKLENGEDFTELATELSTEGISKAKEGDFGWQPKGALAILLGTSIPGEYAFSSESGELSQPIYDSEISKGVGYWIVRVLERDEELETAHVEGILLGSQEEAQRARARLVAGEDFATLAEELSQDEASKESGGDMGWLTPAEGDGSGIGGIISNKASAALDEFVFTSEMGVLSGPICDKAAQTKGGYWLVKVIDIDGDRELDEQTRNLMKGGLLNEWVSSLWDDPGNKTENHLDDELKMWAIEQAMRG